MSGKRRLRALFFLVLPNQGRQWFHGLLLAAPALGLLGCASSSNLLSDVVSGVVAERFGSAADPIASAQLNPDYRYLRVEVQGRPPALLVLGYLDSHPQGDIEVWYSTRGEVIKMQNGRIVATFGLETDWRAVRYQPAPGPWAGAGPAVSTFDRLRDEMPGYRYAIQDRIESRRWNEALPITPPAALARVPAGQLAWFREATLGSTAAAMPPAWFAWGRRDGQATVVYSEQCLSADFCLRLLRWPVQDGAG